MPMASSHAVDPTAANSIFMNCPFVSSYKPLFRAMIFTIIACGYVPRCALDTEDSAVIRIGRIADMIGECDWGIHDLSRVELSRERLPRFNMPLELGIHLGARWLGEERHRGKRALVLDSKDHRYDISLSDISGQDIKSHQNSAQHVVRCVRNWLSAHRSAAQPPLPAATVMWEDYQAFKRDMPRKLKKSRLGTLTELTHDDFLWVAQDWLVKRAGGTP
jgi:hypothetical protein